jgi:ATP-dependent RNA helicase DeaD
MKSPEHIEIKEKQVTVHKIKQYAVETTDRRKEGTLLHLIQEHQPYLAIIFCRTKARVEKLNATLKEKGFLSDELHGDIPQSKRQRAMRNFRDAKLQYLVATDVAARGLDVEGITHVYNYDVPEDVETYIHRTGRTGRASGDGAAYTLYAPRDVDNLLMIEKGIKQTLERVVIKGISIPDREDYEKEREMNIKKARKTAQKKKEFSSSQNQAFNRKKR